MHAQNKRQSLVRHRKMYQDHSVLYPGIQQGSDRKRPLQAGNEVIPVFHKYGQYNGNDNDGFALR